MQQKLCRKYLKNIFKLLWISLKKKKDYLKGGPYFFIKNKKYFLGKYIKRGDAILYNEKIFHGVDKIKSDNPNHLGRISLLSTVYFKNKDYFKN